jgi:arsenite oxidase small subunit
MVADRTVDRRAFLKLTGIGTGAVALSGGAVIAAVVGPRPLGVAVAQQGEKVELAYPDYPDAVIGNLADVRLGEPMFFDYPQAGQRNMLVKLGKPAEEGAGPDGDIVAFSVFCAHMGAPLDGVYNHQHGMLGPCPLHFSTFDLAKSGMNVMGKSVQWLPQVVLKVDADGTLRATGMYGLIYGWPANLLKLEGGN